MNLKRLLDVMTSQNCHPDLAAWWREMFFSPIGARLESSSRCNANCVMCPRAGMTRYQGEMDRDLFVKCVDELSQAPRPMSYLFLHLNGEPLFLDIDELCWRINYAKDKLPHTSVQFFTNGSLLTPDKSEKILASRLDRLNFSFDGGTKQDYESVRRGLSWDSVIENIKTFCRMNNEKGHRIFIQSILLPLNLNRGSIDAYFRLFKTFGIDDVGGAGVNNIGGLVDVGTLRTDLQFRGGSPHSPCWRTFTDINVMADGKVCACCQDVRGSVIHGDARVDHLLDIWKGDSLTKLREEFLMRKHPNLSPEFDMCNKCDFMESFQSNYGWWPQ